jgi:hypothetical protein
VTIGRLVAWMIVWMSGWGLFFVHPAGHSTLGSVLLLAVAPLVMVTPREWRNGTVRRGGILVVALVALFLFLVFVLPPSYRWQFPTDPRLLASLKVVGAAIALFGIGITSHRFARDHAGEI